MSVILKHLLYLWAEYDSANALVNTIRLPNILFTLRGACTKLDKVSLYSLDDT